jgi:hypothetical protein
MPSVQIHYPDSIRWVCFHFWVINFHIGQLMGKLGFPSPSQKEVMHTPPYVSNQSLG